MCAKSATAGVENQSIEDLRYALEVKNKLPHELCLIAYACEMSSAWTSKSNWAVSIGSCLGPPRLFAKHSNIVREYYSTECRPFLQLETTFFDAKRSKHFLNVYRGCPRRNWF